MEGWLELLFRDVGTLEIMAVSRELVFLRPVAMMGREWNLRFVPALSIPVYVFAVSHLDYLNDQIPRVNIIEDSKIADPNPIVPLTSA